MIIGIENKKTVKLKNIKPGIFFYYDKESYLQLMSSLTKSPFWKNKKLVVNLDLVKLNQIPTNFGESQVLFGKLSLKNLWLGYDYFPHLNYFIIK